MEKYEKPYDWFKAIADSLRRKLGSTGELDAEDYPEIIDGLSTGGITPVGTKAITSNGTHDVTAYANAEVNVPTGITPSGTKEITANGEHDVTNFAKANVNVPIPDGYIKPSGTKTITENGTFDISSFASAVVNVAGESAPTITEVRTVTIASDLGAGTATTKTLLSADSFVKQHYADEGFAVTMIPVGTFSHQDSGVIPSIYHGNKLLMSTKSSYYGYVLLSAGASSAATAIFNTVPLTGKTYTAGFRANSSGNLDLYVAAARTVKAGTYLLVLTCTS